MLGHQLDDRAPPRLRHDGAGRVVEGRDRVDERRPEVLGQLLPQLVDDEPFAVDLDAREHGARVEQHPLGPVVNRVLGNDGRTGLEEAHEQPERMERAVRQHDAARMDAEPFADQLAQRRVARAGSVREDPLAVGREDGRRAVGELVERQEVRVDAVLREAGLCIRRV